MSKIDLKAKRTINQTELEKLLNLTSSAIRYLKDNNIIEWKKVGRQIVFDKSSIKRFQQSFNRDAHLTKRQCDAKLKTEGFVSFRIDWRNIYEDPLGFKVNGKTLINGSDDIPPEYMLSAIRFGDTQYIEKESFAKTMNWLKGIHRKLHPPSNELFHPKTDKLWIERTKRKKSPIRGLRRFKRIRIQ
jgi:hypothetical protein